MVLGRRAGRATGALRSRPVSLLEVTGLRTEISTRDGRVVPVDGVTFSLDQGEILGLVGESGSARR